METIRTTTTIETIRTTTTTLIRTIMMVVINANVGGAIQANIAVPVEQETTLEKIVLRKEQTIKIMQLLRI